MNKYTEEIKSYIDFYKSNPQIFINTTETKYSNWLSEIVKEYFDLDVDFINFTNSVVKEIELTKDNKILEIADKYFQVLKIPILILNIEDSQNYNPIEIIPVKKFTADKTLQLFGTWSHIQPDKLSFETWFFESVSNKYFWEEITGKYDYPILNDESKRQLKELIAKAR